MDVNIKKVEKVDDIEKGDIICYKYYCLWYDVVVLEKLDIIEILVVLFIVYYVFYGVCFYYIIIV